MKVVFICHRIPYPPNKGDKIRSYNLLKYLCRQHDVYLFCLIDNPNDLGHIRPLNRLAREVHFDVIKPKFRKLTSSTALFNGLPISVRYFYSAKLQRVLDNVLEKEDIGLIFSFCSPTAEYIFRSRHYQKNLGNITQLMDLVDVDSEKWLDYAQKSEWPRRLIYRMEARYLSRYEARIAKEFDRVFLVSEPEKALFLQKNKASNVTVLSNGVDVDYFTPDFKSQIKKKSPSLVFTGAMDYWPNIDGVVWFATTIFPKIREGFPTATFFIVGANPAPEVRSLSCIEGVQVTGFVEDVRDYIAIADACVVPLRIARGIQNKVLEAMAMGKPVVTTSKALEGIEATPGENVLVSDSPLGFAEQLGSVLSDPGSALSLGLRARKVIEKKYLWENRLAVLDKFFCSQDQKQKVSDLK